MATSDRGAPRRQPRALASPEEVYHRPASPFAARFTGLAGELPVSVTGEEPATADSGPKVSVRPRRAHRGGDTTSITLHRPPGPLGAGGTLLIRPAAVRIHPQGPSTCHLEAVVVDAACRGRGYDHALTVGDDIRLVGVHDQRRWARRDRVSLSLDPAACISLQTLPNWSTQVPSLKRTRGNRTAGLTLLPTARFFSRDALRPASRAPC